MANVQTAPSETASDRSQIDPSIDWARIAYLVHLSRGFDALEETKLVPEKKVLYQFSRARSRHGANYVGNAT